MANVILLVEGNPCDEKLALLMFKRRHILNKIAVVRDGAEALDYVFGTGAHRDRTGRDQLELMLIDTHLARIDGVEVIRRIRERELGSRLPIIMLISGDEHEDILRGRSLGVNIYIRKPIDWEQFVAAMEALRFSWVLSDGGAGSSGPAPP